MVHMRLGYIDQLWKQQDCVISSPGTHRNMPSFFSMSSCGLAVVVRDTGLSDSLASMPLLVMAVGPKQGSQHSIMGPHLR